MPSTAVGSLGTNLQTLKTVLCRSKAKSCLSSGEARVEVGGRGGGRGGGRSLEQLQPSQNSQ